MNTENDDRFQRLLKAIREAKVSAAQAKIRVELERNAHEKVTLLLEYMEKIKELSSLENELLIQYLFEVKAGMVELKEMVKALSISTAGRF